MKQETIVEVRVALQKDTQSSACSTFLTGADFEANAIYIMRSHSQLSFPCKLTQRYPCWFSDVDVLRQENAKLRAQSKETDVRVLTANKTELEALAVAHDSESPKWKMR